MTTPLDETANIPPDLLSAIVERSRSSEAAQRFARVERRMTRQWREAMDRRLAALVQDKGPARKTLPKFYALMEEADKRRRDQVACRGGCDACCHMAVDITEIEAQLIESATGRVAERLPKGQHSIPMEELGRPSTPCPFLVNRRCSIYDVRPLVCRDLAVLDRDALACSFENMALQRASDPRRLTVPQTSVGPVVRAWAELTARNSFTVADIRRFFPPLASGSGQLGVGSR